MRTLTTKEDRYNKDIMHVSISRIVKSTGAYHARRYIVKQDSYASRVLPKILYGIKSYFRNGGIEYYL